MASISTAVKRLLIAADDPDGAAADRWCGSVMDAWPVSQPRPLVDRVSLAEFAGQLRPAPDEDPDAPPAEAAPPADATLMIAGPSSPSSQLYQIADYLDRTAAPGLLVLEGFDDESYSTLVRGVLDGHGLLVERDNADPTQVASALSALMRRQPMLRRLADELRLGQLSQRRIHDELTRVHGELQEAARLQSTFVRCAMPYIPELDVGIVFRPATYVSGDTFDVEPLDDHRVGVFLADAVGHGVPAGMLTLFLNRSLPKIDPGLGAPRIVPPAEALARLNHAYCGRQADSTRFATAAYLVLDLRTMKGELSLAGHPAPMLTTPDGRVDRPDAGGPLLGVFPDATYTSCPVDLSGDSSLVLFTDGFELVYDGVLDRPRSARRGREPHLARLEALGAEAAAGVGDRGRLASAIANLQTELDMQIGSLHQADDVTAVVLAPRPAAAATAARCAA